MSLFKQIDNPMELVGDDWESTWEKEQREKEEKMQEEELDFYEIMDKYRLSMGDLWKILDNNANWRYGSGADYEIIGRLREAIDTNAYDLYTIINEKRLQKACNNDKLKLKGVNRQ